MASLQIDALRAAGAIGRVPVSVVLTDSDGAQVDGHTDTGTIVKSWSGHTDTSGSLDLSLTPNASITPANTYYTVTVAGRSFLVSKGSGTETLEDALAVSPSAMAGIATLNGLDDVDTSGKADGDVLTYDSGTGQWIADPVAGGGGVSSVSGTAPITSTGGATPAIGITAATSGAAGSMSAADKSKLDGIEAGATADQSAAELLTAIKTVDGTGSGLDADLLDGQHATAFEAAGTAAALVDDLSGVSNAATARTNLGLGDSATKNVGTGAGTVAAGDHNHTGVYEAVGVAAALVDDLSGVSDASTARTNLGLGGLATLSAVGSSEITNGAIVNDDVNASAAIALSKLASISTARILGRTTAGSGAIEELSSVDSFVSAASDTTAGKVELATAAETTTGTDATRAVTPDGLAGSEFGVRAVGIMASDMSTAITTGDGKAGFMVPASLNGMNLIRAHAALLAAQSSSGTPTIQIRNATQTADMLSTKITIDANESTSHTAATPPVVDTANDDVATGDLIMVDVDVAGTGAKGLLVTLEFQLP